MVIGSISGISFRQNPEIKLQKKPVSNKKKIAIGIGIACGMSAIYAAKHVNSSVFIKTAKEIKEIATPNVNRRYFSFNFGEIDYDKMAKNDFDRIFTNVVLKPFDYIQPKNNVLIEKRIRSVPAGCVVNGSHSQSKNEQFSDMIYSLQKAGADIVVVGKDQNHSVRDVSEKWLKLYNNKKETDFMKTGKYSVFAVHNLDEILSNDSENMFSMLEGWPLREKSKCAQRKGIILLATVKDFKNIKNVGDNILVIPANRPYVNESKEIWSNYITDQKKENTKISKYKIKTSKKVMEPIIVSKIKKLTKEETLLNPDDYHNANLLQEEKANLSDFKNIFV